MNSYLLMIVKPKLFNFECLIWKSNPIGYLSTPAASVAYFKSMQSKPSFFGSQLSNESVKGSENFPPSIFCRQRPRSLLFWFGYCATISTMGSKYFCSLVWLPNFHKRVWRIPRTYHELSQLGSGNATQLRWRPSTEW